MMTAESLRDWLVATTELAVLTIDSMALVLVVFGSLQAFAASVRVMLVQAAGGVERRAIWLRYARVLVAALTFQLAADIIETSTTADWEAVARLGLVAVIRTFLNYFLERDLNETRERQSSRPADATGPDLQS